MAAAKQRTLRIPDSVWDLFLDAANHRGMGVTELMVEATLDNIASSSPQVRELVEVCRDEFRRRGLKVRDKS